MTKIDPTYYLSNVEQRTPSSRLGKEEFLKILMAQLQNQDPLSPLDDKDFIAQMATFSSLEQLMHMSQSIDALVQNQLISPVVQYSHMIGKEVTYVATDNTGKAETVTNKVKAVSQKDGWAILELENGDKILADSILKVGAASSEDDKS